MQIPPPSSCLDNSAVLTLAACLSQRPGSKRKSLSSTVRYKSQLTADLLCESVCVRELVSMRFILEVCSPFPQSQLCTGSWPRCPTVRRQRCEGWPHSSPGSLLPVERAGRRWETAEDTLKAGCFNLNYMKIKEQTYKEYTAKVCKTPKLFSGFWLPFAQFFVKMSPHCFNNMEVQALRRPIHYWKCSSECFSKQLCFCCWKMKPLPICCFADGSAQWVERESQTLTEPPPCFTDGCRQLEPKT